MISTAQYKWINETWEHVTGQADSAQICLLFGSRPTIEKSSDFLKKIKVIAPLAEIVTVSTAGNIQGNNLMDEAIIATCIHFEKTKIVPLTQSLKDIEGHALGVQIAKDLDRIDLAHVMLFSTTGINAGQLLNGINEVIKGRIPVAGGIAGDDTRFEKTLVGLNDSIQSDQLVAIGFYGESLNVAHGSRGGWDTFGPERKATKCDGNILYEIDGKPVLDLYKNYLGEKANNLPASALHFPFAIIDKQTSEHVVRGVQNINEKDNSLILFGDVFEGDTMQLMRANFDRIITAAGESAKEAFRPNKSEPELAILVSCVARRLVLDQLTEEELDEAKNALGDKTAICGFYSYSELSPIVGDDACHVHNQTMTITTMVEV